MTTARKLNETGSFKSKIEDDVSISSLSSLTGFPTEFIKKELVLEEDVVQMSELRESLLEYLNTTFDDLNN